MGALFDLRRDPPAAPAHWSTSIRSIARSAGRVAAALPAGLRTLSGGVGLYSSPVEARPAGLTSNKPRAAESAAERRPRTRVTAFPSQKPFIRAWPRVWATDSAAAPRSTRTGTKRRPRSQSDATRRTDAQFGRYVRTQARVVPRQRETFGEVREWSPGFSRGAKLVCA